jgi:hypothetical protein
MRETYEPPNEIDDRQLLPAWTGEPAEETTARAIDKLVGQAIA